MKTIVIVDDEFDLLASIEAILAEAGYRVVACSNGKEALALIEELKPDLVITDFMMPYLNGIELLDEMRAREELTATPAILMSCVVPSKTAHPPDAFLPKPFTIDQLMGLVSKALGEPL